MSGLLGDYIEATHTRAEWIEIMHMIKDDRLFKYINEAIGDFDESERHQPLTIRYSSETELPETKRA